MAAHEHSMAVDRSFAGGTSAEIIPFPTSPIPEMQHAVPPGSGRLMRTIVNGRAFTGRVDPWGPTCISPELARYLVRIEGATVWFPSEKRCAREYWLPVIGLARPIRAVEWEPLTVPVLFGREALDEPRGLAVYLGSATILRFPRRRRRARIAGGRA